FVRTPSSYSATTARSCQRLLVSPVLRQFVSTLSLFSFDRIDVEARFCRWLAGWITTATSSARDNAGSPHQCDILFAIEQECDWWPHADRLAGLQFEEFVALVSAVCHESSIVQSLKYQ